jgi:hypothetical protein
MWLIARRSLTLLQVEGCTADLSSEKAYCQKKAVCSAHLKVCHTVCWQHVTHITQAWCTAQIFEPSR